MHFCHKSAPLLLPELKIFTNVTEVVDLLDSIGHSWTTLVVIGRKLFYLAHITDLSRSFPNSLTKAHQRLCSRSIALVRPMKDTPFCPGHWRGGKVISYNPEIDHRIKDNRFPPVMWVHTKLNSVQLLQQEWRLSQHLFGWHLLPRSPYLVDLVEAEKTVVCSAVFPKCLWLATGGLSQFNDRLNALHGSKVVAFPDLGWFDKWVVKVRNYQTLDITVSDYLESIAPNEMLAMGADLADWVVEMRAK